MKQISFWAKQHPVFTRWLIVFLYLPLNLLAINTGKQLGELGIVVSKLFLDIAVLLTIAAVFLYKNKASYFYRKGLDFTLIAATFMIVCFYGNHPGQKQLYLPFSQNTVAVNTIYPYVNVQENPSTAVKNKQTWSKKEIRKSVRSLIKKHKKEEGTGSKVILIVVTIVVSLVLLYLLAGLSCTIACNGSEALAYIVFLLGTFGIVFGAIRIIKSIQKKKPKAESPDGV